MLPMRPGQIERGPHDYKLHGTTPLFAALDIAIGAVIGKCYRRHRAPGFRHFLDKIEKAVPDTHDVQLAIRTEAPDSGLPTILHQRRERPAALAVRTQGLSGGF